MKRDSRGEVKSTPNEKTAFLPPELITEILLKLPVKYLLRFKSVCKLWLSLIADPQFAISHFELADQRTDRIVLFASSIPEVRSIDFNASLQDDSASALLNFDFMEPYDYVEINGSCRGFLLLDLNDILCLWNPTTGFHQFLDWSPMVLSEMNLRSCVILRGFGYDASTDDYLIVQAFFNPDDHVTRLEYFSVRAYAWKEIEATHLSDLKCSVYMDNITGWLLNGAMHWLAFSFDISEDVIVAFDISQRSFSGIPVPVDFEYDNFKFCLLGVLGEFLSLCAEEWNHSIEIWVMQEYKVKSSWTKTIVVSVHDIPTEYFFLVCSTKSGDIVGTDGNDKLLKCNDKGQLQEHRSYCDDPHESRMAVYTESLLSLPCQSKGEEEND